MMGNAVSMTVERCVRFQDILCLCRAAAFLPHDLSRLDCGPLNHGNNRRPWSMAKAIQIKASSVARPSVNSVQTDYTNPMSTIEM